MVRELLTRTSELHLTSLMITSYRRPTVRLYRRNIINKVVDINDKKVALRAGIVGQADLYGWARTPARKMSVPLEIELKGAGTSVSDAQMAWENTCRDWGVLYLRLRANWNEESVDTISRWTYEVDRFLATAFAGAQ